MTRRSPLRIGWALATIGGATAVGITTRQPSFVVITFLGGLALPRLLGFGGWHGHHQHLHAQGGPFGRHGRCHGAQQAAATPGAEETATA